MLKIGLILGLANCAPVNPASCSSSRESLTVLLNETFETETGSAMHPSESFSVRKQEASDNSSELSVKPLVEGHFCDAIATVGQARMVLKTVENEEATDADYFYALGFAEGYLTAKRIVQQIFNVVWSQPKHNTRVYDFLITQYNFMRTNARQKSRSDPFWFQVGLQLARLDGMTDGIKARQQEVSAAMVKPKKDVEDSIWPFYLITSMDLYGLNAVSELDEIIASFAHPGEHVAVTRFTDLDDNTRASLAESDLILQEHEMAEKTKCSALVKLVHANDTEKIDLIASHNTWTSYGEMLRIYKTFSFPHVEHHSFKNKRMSMSSYPGYMSSTDDWITLPETGLLITETTNECISKHRLREFVVPNSVTTNIRGLIASVMSSSGSEWFDHFSSENSGTYNNQWIIVDFAKFDSWKRATDQTEIPNNVLWIGEQAPGLIISKDMTDHLFETSFWASYNRPFFSEIANVSGYTSAIRLKGEWFHHQKCPRARMFAALESAVQDIESMKSIMTLNRYDRMNASYLHTHNCPKNQIAGRYDVDAHLRPNSQDDKKCGPVMAYGALDCKITSTEMMKNDSSLMMSGPAWNNSVAAFNWSQLPGFAQVAHWGHPEMWNFGFLKWEGENIDWSDGGLVDNKIQLPPYVIGKKQKPISPENHNVSYIVL